MSEQARARNLWAESASAWVSSMGDRGDISRAFILDRPMLDLVGDPSGLSVADIGCGEGRFSRMLSSRGARVVGLDPTLPLLLSASCRGNEGFILGASESIPLRSGMFDIAISYLVLIDVQDVASACREMARILKPGGRLLIANLNPFATAKKGCPGWVKDEEGTRLHFAVDDYFDERPYELAWGGIKIINWHRTAETYFTALLEARLVLSRYLEPKPNAEDVAVEPSLASELRVPLFHVMEWQKPRDAR